MKPGLCFFLTVLLIAATDIHAATASFTPLGDLPGGRFRSVPKGVSRDGSVVVGWSTGANGDEAFRWTKQDGMVGLGFIPGKEVRSVAVDVSADGSVIVGEGYGEDEVYEAFMWTAETGIVGLGGLPGGGSESRAWGISDDGTVIVGTSKDASGFTQMYRWTADEGMVLVSENDKTFLPRGISGDGKVIVGNDPNTFTMGEGEAFKWTSEGGMIGLGDLPGGPVRSWANAASFDGSVIVGSSSNETHIMGGPVDRPVRWTPADGLVRIDAPPEITIWGFADDVSDNGTIIVGTGTINDQLELEGMFIWDADNGPRYLREVLVNDYGLGPVLEGWGLVGVELIDSRSPQLISGDGKSIVGMGRNPQGGAEAFLIYFEDPLVPEPPAITLPPTTQSVNAGGDLTLTVEASGDPEPTYQWQLNGEDIPGATDASYTIPSVQRFHAGEYTVVVTNMAGSATSLAATLTVEDPAPSDARLINLSTRGLALTGDNVLIPGFVVQGTESKRLLIRAVGPTLGESPFFVPGVLPDPKMVLKRWNGASYEDYAENDNWGDNANADDVIQAMADLYAFGFQNELEAALLLDLPAGQYTAIVDGVSGATGVGLVELYDADDSTVDARLINISTRGYVGTGAEVMIPGFVVSNEGPKTFLIRVVGPRLAEAPFNVSGTLADPKLELYRQENGSTLWLTQDNWSESPDAANTATTAAAVYAFALTEGSADAAFVVTLPPGIYTVVGSSVDGTGTGVVVVEVYLVQ